MSRKPTVAVCVPSGDDWKADFGVSLARMLARTAERGEVAFGLYNYRGSMLVAQRADLARAALANGADLLLWIDSDSLFPADLLTSLLAWRKPIVGVTYAKKGPIPGQLCGARTLNPPEPIALVPGATGLEEVEALGFGTLLVRAEVFRAIPEPWFVMPWDEGARCYWGEDYFFSVRAREAGFKLLLDCGMSLRVAHIGSYNYSAGGVRLPADVAREIWHGNPSR